MIREEEKASRADGGKPEADFIVSVDLPGLAYGKLKHNTSSV